MRCKTLAKRISLAVLTVVISFEAATAKESFSPSPSDMQRGGPGVGSLIQPQADPLSNEAAGYMPSASSGPMTSSSVGPSPSIGSSRSSGAVEQGFSPFIPTTPSAVTPMLRYMMCDPYSCPNLWAGYDAQRAAEKARNCSPHGFCGDGCGCGGVSLYPTACNTCGPSIKCHLNRYRRATTTTTCDSCSDQSCSSSGH